MRLKSVQLHWIAALICALTVARVDADFLGDVFAGGDKNPPTPGPAQPPSAQTTAVSPNTQPGSVSQPAPSASTPPPNNTPIIPLPTIPNVPSTNPTPSTAPGPSGPPTNPSTPASPSNQPASPTRPSAGPRSSVATHRGVSDSATATPSSTSTPTSDTNVPSEEPKGSNTGVIVGSVCAFVAVIGAGFGYAFFSKTRRNNRKKRMQEELPSAPASDYNNTGSHGPFDNSRRAPSPAMAAAAIAGDGYGKAPPQEMEYAHNDPYYSPPMPNTALSPMTSYPDAAVSGAYYAPAQQYYYDQQQQDPNQYYYAAGAPAPAPMPANMMHSGNPAGPVYSAPNTYDEHGPQQHGTPQQQHLGTPQQQHIGTPQQQHQQAMYPPHGTPYYPMGGEPYR